MENSNPNERRNQFLGCIASYLVITYTFGLMGAAIPPRIGPFLVILPAIPCIAVFHVFFGLLVYIVLASIGGICAWRLLEHSKLGAWVLAITIGVMNGFLSSRLSWQFGP